MAGTARAATLRGEVLDPSGRPVPNAQVTLLGPLKSVAESRTDAEGRYEFESLVEGSYELVTNAAGFSAASSDVEISRGDARSVDLRLEISAVQQQVVVSAALGGALAPEIGSSVSVVSQLDMTNEGDQMVLDALRQVPGVAVNQTGRHGGATGVFIRGGDSDYNLVMVDGISVNEFGGGFDFASLPVDGVSRVEVTRGPESALYGSNAVTGVINIVTERGEGRPHFSALAEGGSFGTWRYSTGGSGLTRGLGWAFDLSRLTSVGVVPNDDYRDQTAFLSLDYTRSKRRQVTFRFFGNSNDAGAPGPFGSDPLGLFPGIDRISRDKQNLFGYQLSYAEDFTPRFRQVVTASLSTNNLFFHTPYGDSYSDNLRGAVNTLSEIALSSKDFLVAGFEYNRDQITNTFIADASGTPFLLPRTSDAAFVENRWNPSRRWFITTGLRVDDIQTHSLPPGGFGERPLLLASSVTKVNPRTSAAYLLRQRSSSDGLGETRFHASFGTGIRAPSGFELAFTNNPSLKPEKSVSFDAGIEQRLLRDRAALDVTWFENRFKDQIVVLGGSLANLSSFSSGNLANARARGAEFSFRLRPLRSLELEGSYTRLDTAILALDGSTLAQTPFQVGQTLVRQPRNSAGYNATWRRGRLMLNLNGTVRGPVLDVEPNIGLSGGLFRNKGYVLANSGFAYRLPRGLELEGRLNNFLNQKYEESFGYPALHLNFMAGVRFNFPAE